MRRDIRRKLKYLAKGFAKESKEWTNIDITYTMRWNSIDVISLARYALTRRTKDLTVDGTRYHHG